MSGGTPPACAIATLFPSSSARFPSASAALSFWPSVPLSTSAMSGGTPPACAIATLFPSSSARFASAPAAHSFWSSVPRSTIAMSGAMPLGCSRMVLTASTLARNAAFPSSSPAKSSAASFALMSSRNSSSGCTGAFGGGSAKLGCLRACGGRGTSLTTCSTSWPQPCGHGVPNVPARPRDAQNATMQGAHATCLHGRKRHARGCVAHVLQSRRSPSGSSSSAAHRNRKP